MSKTLAVVDDFQLRQLARPRAVGLFPLLRRAVAMTPLLIVMALVPGLLAMKQGAITDHDARWGLKSIDLIASGGWQDILTPTPTGQSVGLRWQSPLSSTTTAWAMRIVGSNHSLGLFLVPYLATAVLILTAYSLVSQTDSGRAGFWTTVMLAGHGLMLGMVTMAGPVSLSVALALATFWGFLSHVANEKKWVSPRLLAGGVSWGLLLLCGGPLCLVVLVVLLTTCLAMHRRGQTRQNKPAGEIRWRLYRPAGWSLAIMTLLAAVVGGWWLVVMLWDHHFRFLSAWLIGRDINVSVESIPVTELSDLGRRFVALTGPLFGLTLLGIYCLARHVWHEGVKHPGRVFLLSWLTAALVWWLIVWIIGGMAEHLRLLSDRFLTVACVAMAAVAIEEISQRRVGVLTASSMAALTYFVLAGFAVPVETEGDVIAIVWWVFVLIVILLALGFLLWQFTHDRDARQRAILAGLILAQVLAGIAVGVASLNQRDQDEIAMQELQSVLNSHGEAVDRLVLISPRPASPRLQYSLRSISPRSELVIADGWDEIISGSRSPNVRKTLILSVRPERERPQIELRGLRITRLPQRIYYRRRLLQAFEMTHQVR